MKINKKVRMRRTPLLVLGALLAALCIAACGSSSSSSGAANPTSTTASATLTAYSSCLKKHGVTLPTGVGKGGFGKGGAPSGAPTGGAPTGGGSTQAGGVPTGSAPTAGGTPGGGGGLFSGKGAGGLPGASAKSRAAFKACESVAPKAAKGGFGAAGGFKGRPGGKGFKRGATPQFSTKVLDSFVACVRKNGYAAMPEASKSSQNGALFPKSVENNADFKKALPKCEAIIQKAFSQSSAAPSSSAPTTSNS